MNLISFLIHSILQTCITFHVDNYVRIHVRFTTNLTALANSLIEFFSWRFQKLSTKYKSSEFARTAYVCIIHRMIELFLVNTNE